MARNQCHYDTTSDINLSMISELDILYSLINKPITKDLVNSYK